MARITHASLMVAKELVAEERMVLWIVSNGQVDPKYMDRMEGGRNLLQALLEIGWHAGRF